jgi:RNA-directed DNA polymerase
VRSLSATRLVIVCCAREEALAALAVVRAWTDEAGLKLHPAKTHVGDCRLPGQGFEFLGYRFEAGRRLVRKKSLAKLKDSIRAKTARNRGDSLKVVIADLNPMLRGCSATSSKPIQRHSARLTASFVGACGRCC